MYITLRVLQIVEFEPDLIPESISLGYPQCLNRIFGFVHHGR